ncbi:MAG: hypothetical protein J3Q66DRAFT_8308 [Benniella sp.]|nr:MAG: hypothetical protein J3Q66DRAFT_8308 [Benniella sp.]
MDASELESYKEQVATIETALQADPNNAELQILKTELLDLISLTESLQQQQQEEAASPLPSSAAAAGATLVTSSSSPSVSSSVRTSPSVTSSPSRSSSSSPFPSTTATSATKPSGVDPSKQPIYQPLPSRQWAVGDKCRALYAADGRYYEATILSIGGGGQVYSVQYKGYESSAPGVVGPQDLKAPHDPKKYQKNNAAAGATNEGENKKRSAEESVGGAGAGGSGGAGGGGGGGGAKKKKSTGPSEQVQKQQAWQNFAKGAGGKKTKGAAPILKKSIFASPDNPEGKVGVVGSGKGMTQFQQRGKHIYGQSQQDNGN